MIYMKTQTTKWNQANKTWKKNKNINKEIETIKKEPNKFWSWGDWKIHQRGSAAEESTKSIMQQKNQQSWRQVIGRYPVREAKKKKKKVKSLRYLWDISKWTNICTMVLPENNGKKTPKSEGGNGHPNSRVKQHSTRLDNWWLIICVMASR